MRTILCAGLLALCGAFPALAQERPSPMVQSNSNALWFGNWVGLSNATLLVVSPDGNVETVTAERQSPVYELKAPVSDGYYRFELRAATSEREPVEDDGRLSDIGEDGPATQAVLFSTTGVFLVERGAIVPRADMPPAEES